MTKPVNLQPYAYFEGNPTHMPVPKHSYRKCISYIRTFKIAALYSDHSATGRQPPNLIIIIIIFIYCNWVVTRWQWLFYM